MIGSREELAWAAGIFEGEGSFYTNPRNGQRTVATIQMTDEDVMRTFHGVIGVGRMFGPYQQPALGNIVRKPSWRWTAGSFEHTQAFIAMVWPWLHSRRRMKAREVLAERTACTCRQPGIRGRHKAGCGVG